MGFRYRSIVAGITLGSLSAFLSYHLATLFHFHANLFIRAINAVGISLVVPGLMAAIITGNARASSIWLVAAVNFIFWFGFAWLVGLFIIRLMELRRAIAAVRISRGKASSLRSE